MADYYVNFAYAGHQDSPVTFEYTFKFNNQLLEYIYSKRPNGTLITEKVSVDHQQVFERNESALSIDEEQFPMESSMKVNLSNNANHVSIINFLLTSYPLSKNHYLIKLQNFVSGMLWFRGLKVNEYMGFDSIITNLDQYIINHNLSGDFEKFLYEVSGQVFRFAEPQPNDKMLVCRYGDTFDSIRHRSVYGYPLPYVALFLAHPT